MSAPPKQTASDPPKQTSSSPREHPASSPREHPASDPREHAAGDPPKHTSSGPRDITTRQDCEQLVRAFYGRALTDPVIGWIFTDVAHLDLDAHVPRIASFWETVLLGAQSYSGGAFRPHALLNERVRLRGGHFERWLWLWRATVEELFAGPRAELAKTHAERVARAFHSRLHSGPGEQAPAPGAELITVVPVGAPPAR